MSVFRQYSGNVRLGQSIAIYNRYPQKKVYFILTAPKKIRIDYQLFMPNSKYATYMLVKRSI